MNKYILFIITLLIFTTYVSSKEVVGWVENVAIYGDDGKIIVKAKIDTGAKTTSLHSKDYALYNKNGKQWIKFKIINNLGNSLELEKPVVRMAEIKRHFGKKQVRPVIHLGLCLGSNYKITEVNLVDRSEFNYQLLVGRAFLKPNNIVDPSVTYTKEPDCGNR